MLPRFTDGRWLLLCAVALMRTLNAGAQAILPEGVEANVSGPLPGDQVQPSASLAAEGGILVWQDSRIDGAGSGIAALRLDAGLNAAGEPFRVNARGEGEQQRPRVARLEGGGAVFVWSERNRGLSQVYARFQGADGSFAGPEIAVTPAAQITSSKVVTNVVGWKKNRLRRLKHTLRGGTAHHREMGGEAEVIALRGGGAAVVYSAIRRAQTNATEIITEVTFENGRPFTNDVPRPVVMRSHWMKDVFVQVFAADGRKVGEPVLVNQHVANNQHQPAVALLDDGRFVVVWVSEIDVAAGLNIEMPVSAVAAVVRPMRMDIRGRLFTADGAPAGDEFLVSGGTGVCAGPAVASSPGGGFVAVWAQSGVSRARASDIYSRSFLAEGQPAGEVNLVNTDTQGAEVLPRVAGVGDNHLVAWISLGQDGSWEGVYARQLAGGVPAGSEFRVNTTTEGRQLHAAVVANGVDRIAVFWTGFVLASSFDIYAQVYAAAPAVPLAAADENTGNVGTEIPVAGGGNEPARTPEGPLPPTPPASVVGAGSPAAPLRLTPSATREKLRIAWDTDPGARYQVQISVDLRTWTDWGEPRTATGHGEIMSIDRNQPAAYFRVIRLP